MGTGTHVAEGRSWEEVTAMEINLGIPGASPPPPGPQAQSVLLWPSSLSQNVEVSELSP